MATSTEKMICPRCGSEMNHHSDKLINGAGPLEPPDATEDDPGETDSLLGGLITQFHTCPRCGAAAARNA